jgi:putative membrane-bound dehydrogenase-like protein
MLRLMLRFSLIILLVVGISPKGAAQELKDVDLSSELPRIEALSPEDARKSFELAEGFEIELVASEPLVTDPIAFSFDARGRLFVVEMMDYSEQANESLGQIALLTDKDGDGVMDERSTFAEGLSWPTALHAWGDGVIVIAPPKMICLRDRNDDGKSDESELWYDGFSRNNVQGMANSLRWSVDGYIEGSSGTNGGEFTLADGSKLHLRGRDFRLDPRTRSLQPTSGGGQHGMAFNRWGDKFVTSNSDHLQQVVDLDEWSAKFATSIVMPPFRRSIAEDGPQAEVFRASPVEPWRIVRTRLRVSGTVTGPIEGGGRAAGYFTGATGTWIMPSVSPYAAGDNDTAFVCDVGSNLVHRKRLIGHGLYFSGKRIDEQTEFLRSKDIWFRPVQLGDGPDGSLYIADMYREVIEHPLSLPPVIKKHLDLTSGRDRGRIWRVRASNSPRAGTVNLQDLKNPELVKQLANPVQWQRLMAHQLLIERQATDVQRSLEEVIRHHADAQTRFLALTSLDRLGNLTEELLNTSLTDSHPRVAAKSIALADKHGWLDSCAGSIAALSGQGDANIQLELAKVLGRLPAGIRPSVIAKLASNASEPIIVAIMATSLRDEGWNLVDSLSQTMTPENAKSFNAWVNLLLPIWAEQLKQTNSQAKTQSELNNLLEKSLDKPIVREAWLDVFAQSPHSTSLAVLGALKPEQQQLLMAAIRTSLDKATGVAEISQNQLRAIAWARLLPFDELDRMVEDIVEPRVDNELQYVFCQSLLSCNSAQATKQLLAKISTMSPQLRDKVLAAMISYRESAPAVAQAVIEKEIPSSHLSSSLQQALIASVPADLVEPLRKSFATSGQIDPAIMEKYLASVQDIARDADSQKRGREVFRRECAACHRIGGIGSDVGPPLKQLGTKTAEQLVTTILDPNREVDSKYMAYVALVDGDRVISGVIQEESETQIVFAISGGERVVVLRSNLQQLQTQGKSLMPTDLHLKVTQEEMRDLISFLQNQDSGESPK